MSRRILLFALLLGLGLPRLAFSEIRFLPVIASKSGERCIDPLEVPGEVTLRSWSVPPASIPGEAGSPDLPRFIDPMGGGMNASGRTVLGYPDLIPTADIGDYSCRTATYDGHKGTDILVLNFPQMDAGVPVHAAAPGVVIFARDGEYDRHLEWQNNSVGNAVILDHDDGLETRYWHMRKHSVRVSLGDTVAAGDTLGLVGSSGRSAFPHLHFEVGESTSPFRDPFAGSCQGLASMWEAQGAHTLDLPSELQDSGILTLPVTKYNLVERVPTKTHVVAGEAVTAWIMLRSAQPGDRIRFQFLFANNVWAQEEETVEDPVVLAWWASTQALPTDSAYHGLWTVRAFQGERLLAEHAFTHDDVPNQAPEIVGTLHRLDRDTVLQGELTSQDPDGSVFWHRFDLPPRHGTLLLRGVRQKQFEYTPDPGFTGLDSARVFAQDDELTRGPSSWLTFEVGTAVPLAAVSQLRAVAAGEGIALSWWGHHGDFPATLRIEKRAAGEKPYRFLSRVDLAPGEQRFLDTSVEPGIRYDYRLVVRDRAGNQTVFGPVTAAVGAFAFALHAGDPNPFREATRLRYALPAPGPVSLAVLDARGRLVRTLESASGEAGVHTASWDGRDDRGSRVPTGVYFFRLEWAGARATRKALFIRE